MDEDDDDLVWGRPPPDPSMRSWRHPSELAAEAAGQPPLGSGTESPAGSGNRRRFLAGTTVGAVLVVVGLASLFNGGALDGIGFGDDEAFELDSAAGSASALVSTTLLSASTAGTTPSTTTAPSGSASDATTLTSAPAGGSEPGAGLVAVVDSSEDTVAATAIVLQEGMLVTSASALTGRTELRLRLGDSEVVAHLVGTDLYTDVALLRPADDTVALPEPLPMAGRPLAEGDTFRLLALDEDGELVATDGSILARSQEIYARNGHTVMGVLMTDAHCPNTGAGAVLITEDGDATAMVIGGDSSLADAVDLTVVAETARSLNDTGWGDPAWIGISGSATDTGIRVDAASAGGPAAAAGIAAGDVLVGLDGRPLTTVAELVGAVRSAGPSGSVELVVDSDGERQTVTITLAQRPPKSTDADPTDEPLDG